MKKYLYLIYFFLLFISLSNNLQSNIQNSIVAKIDKKIITSFEVKNKILSTLILSGNEISQENIDNLKRQSLDSLIFYKLKQIELENFNFKIDEQRLNSYINKIAKNDLKKLKNDFKSFGVDFTLWKKEIETELNWQQFIYFQYSKKIDIDENSINEEVNKIIQSSLKNQEVNLSEIEVFQDEKTSNEELISKILEQISKDGFENTALKFSISESSTEKGSLGWVDLNILSEKIRNSIKILKPGQISEPIIRPESILFLKLNSLRASQNKLDDETIRKNLINLKQNEQFNLYSRSHLSKLKNNNLIQYK